MLAALGVTRVALTHRRCLRLLSRVREAAAAGHVSKEALGDPLPRGGGRSAENHEKMGASRLQDSQVRA